MLAHEAAHLSSGDAAVNAALALAQGLFWFNPLIHYGARQARIDQELACDAAVLAAYPSERRPYAEALLKAQLPLTPLPLGCYWPAGASNLLKERIAMLTFKTPSRARRLCGAAAVVTLGLGAGFSAWAVQPSTVTFENAVRAEASPSIQDRTSDAAFQASRMITAPSSVTVHDGAAKGVAASPGDIPFDATLLAAATTAAEGARIYQVGPPPPPPAPSAEALAVPLVRTG